ncbi:MAG: OmpA family protein [Pseudomonadota bacterium]
MARRTGSALLAATVALPLLMGGGAVSAEEAMTREEILARWKAQAEALDGPVQDVEIDERGLQLGATAAGAGAGSASTGEVVTTVEETEPPRFERAITVDFRITFDTDSAVIRDSARPELERLCAAVKAADESWRFNIIGHADAAGSSEYNRTLSEARAREVARRLTADCAVDSARLTVWGLGEERLLPDEPPVSEANRRVEVSLAQS